MSARRSPARPSPTQCKSATATTAPSAPFQKTEAATLRKRQRLSAAFDALTGRRSWLPAFQAPRRAGQGRAARPRSRSGTDSRPSTCKCPRRVAPVIPDGLGSRADRARPCSKTSMEQGRQFCTSVGGGRRTRKNACNSGLPSAAQAVAGDVALMISRSCSASTSCISRCRSRVRACCATSYAKEACTSARAELDARARELGVEHTSRMTKADLARAIAKKQR
jgi:hypothetical protein